MNEKKHIDRLFQEKFKNFEVTPDDAVWDRIHNDLHKDKRKRRVIPIWWYAAGVAAILVLLLTVGNVFNHGESLNNPENKVVGTENNQDEAESNKTNIVNENESGSGNNESNNSTTVANRDGSGSIDPTSESNIPKKSVKGNDKPAAQIAKDDSYGNKSTDTSNSQAEVKTSRKGKMVISNSKEEAVAQNTSNLRQINSDKEIIVQSKSAKIILENEEKQTNIAKHADQDILKDKEPLNENKDTILLNKKDESIEEAIAKANPTDDEEKEPQPNRWNITPNVAPVYFSSLGKGSSIDNQFVNNGKNGEVNMSYGISGSYAINDKIKIRAGVNKVDLGYSTNGVTAFRDVQSFNNTSAASAELQNINFNRQAKGDAYMSTTSIKAESAPQFVVSNVNGSLEQQFGYIEVPLEVEYNIINSKFGLNVIGGFSTLFLNNNEVYSVLGNERMLLGEANNINSTSYSANLGLGLNYNVSHSLKLNLEPMFKYQMNTFTNTSGDFRPYFIGVYTGFSFKF